MQALDAPPSAAQAGVARHPAASDRKFAASLTKLTNWRRRATATPPPAGLPAVNRCRNRDLRGDHACAAAPWHSRCDMARRGAATAAQAQTSCGSAAPSHRIPRCILGEESNVDADSRRQVVRSQRRGSGPARCALLVALIALVAIVAVEAAGNSVATIFQSIADELAAAA